MSDESGRPEVWVERFPGGGDRLRVSNDRGRDPAWSADGTELFFREGNRMMAAPAREGDFGRPEMLFERPLLHSAARDGRFLAVLPDETAPPPVVDVVLNWFDELRRLAPST